MARKPRESDSNGTAPVVVRKSARSMADYVFEEHLENGSINSLGLVLHYPSEAALVRVFLETNKDKFGIEGTVKVCKKIYA